MRAKRTRVRPVRTDWAKKTTEQKIEAVRTDVNQALDLAENLEIRVEELEQLKALIERLARSVFEIERKLGMPPPPPGPLPPVA